jgi:putative endonuclease
MAQHHQTGKTGEETASLYLQNQGYTLLARNFRYQRAEIDIIAQKAQILVFVEVKTRASNRFGYPEEAVSAKKIALFLLAAEAYIQQINWQHDIRFDIISITAGHPTPEIHHIEDAFH